MIHFLIFFFLLQSSSADETFQNSSNICRRCSCNDAQTFLLDCSNQNFTTMLAMWPTDKPIRAIFTGNDFTTLEKLPPTASAVEVVISRCNIKLLDTAVFENAIKTKFVDLSYNLLTSDQIMSDNFRGPFVGTQPQDMAIEDLNLAYNQIHSLHKDVFKFLPNLTRLNLEGNDFKVLDLHTQLALAKIPKLLSLNLANNELVDLVPGAIENFHALLEINLAKNDFDFVPSSLEVVGKTLKVLILDQNPIIEINSESFADLTNLIQVSANNMTKLKRIGAGSFTAPSLTKLSLCNNTLLYDIHAEAFSPKIELKELELTNDNLTGLSSELLHWSLLDILSISNNPLMCSCDLYHIAGALPEEITRTNDGPTCTHPTTWTSVQVYTLHEDICNAKVTSRVRLVTFHISVPLVGLLVVLTVATILAIAMAYNRYRRFMQGRNEPFASQVMYSPLMNAYSRA